MKRPAPACLTLDFDGATVELRLPLPVLDRFYVETAPASPRERRALVAELLATYSARRPSYLWRGRPVDRFRALALGDQDRVVMHVLEVIYTAREAHLPPRRPESRRDTYQFEPMQSAVRRHGRS